MCCRAVFLLVCFCLGFHFAFIFNLHHGNLSLLVDRHGDFLLPSSRNQSLSLWHLSCTPFWGWVKANFLHINWYGVVFSSPCKFALTDNLNQISFPRVCFVCDSNLSMISLHFSPPVRFAVYFLSLRKEQQSSWGTSHSQPRSNHLNTFRTCRNSASVRTGVPARTARSFFCFLTSLVSQRIHTSIQILYCSEKDTMRCSFI